MKSLADRSTLAYIVLGLGTVSLLPSVETASAQCVSGWEWSYNSEGQNPCEIARSLEAPCVGDVSDEFSPLDEGTYYAPPQEGNKTQDRCDCNTVIYSLVAACSLCQRDYNTTPNSWGLWSQHCNEVYVTQYPFDIPSNAAVPNWAYVNYTDGSFDTARARKAGRYPERFPPVATLSSVGPLSTTPTRGNGIGLLPSSTSSEGSGGKDSSGGSKTSVTIIAGGIVGGVVVLAGLVGLAFLLFKRRNRNTNNVPGTNRMPYGLDGTSTSALELWPPRLYNPSDPSTFPPPYSIDDPAYSGRHTQNPHHGRYGGIAEL